jgi:hypothetical protein
MTYGHVSIFRVDDRGPACVGAMRSTVTLPIRQEGVHTKTRSHNRLIQDKSCKIRFVAEYVGLSTPDRLNTSHTRIQ